MVVVVCQVTCNLASLTFGIVGTLVPTFKIRWREVLAVACEAWKIWSSMQIQDPNRFALTAFTFEAALGAIAIGIGFYVHIDPLGSVPFSRESVQGHVEATLKGIVATLPLVVALLVIKRLPQGPFVRLRRLVYDRLVPMFAPLSLFELAAISIAAGFGEEVLFRGLVQAGVGEGIGEPNGVMIGLVATSIIFGLCHWLTPTYAVIATVGGFYFGALFIWSGNLLTPIVAHGLYDFFALAYLTKPGKLPPTDA